MCVFMPLSIITSIAYFCVTTRSFHDKWLTEGRDKELTIKRSH